MKICILFTFLTFSVVSAQDVIQVKFNAVDGVFESDPIALNAGDRLSVNLFNSDRDRSPTFWNSAEDIDGETYNGGHNRVLPALIKRSTQIVRVNPGFPNPHAGQWTLITITIERAPSDVELVNPANLLVLPENSSGDHDVVIEMSNDLLEWTPFFSQTVNSQTAKRFFRTRVVKKN